MTDKRKNVIKEKFVTIYETFFKGEDFTVKPSNFWDELFLLKLNSTYIINEFKNLPSNEDLIKLKKNINCLYNKAIDCLKFETNPIRLHNSLHTLYLFTYSISVTSKIKLNSIETLEFLFGIDNAEAKFQGIFETIYSILISEDTHHFIKTLALKYLLALVTQIENVNDNLFLEYFMQNNGLFEAVIHIVSDPKSRQLYGRDAVLLLTILLQYHKYESENPYVVKLSILDDEMALTGLAQVMSSVLAEYNRIYSNNRRAQEGESSWWNNVGTLIGNMFIGDEEKRRLSNIDDSILLVFYESVHLNRNFISTLTHAATEFSDSSTSSSTQIPGIVAGSSGSPPISPSGSQVAPGMPAVSSVDLNSSFDASSSMMTPAGANAANNNMRLLNPLSLTMPTSSSTTSSTSANMVDITDVSAATASATSAVLALDAANQAINPPTNLLVIFLESCSAVLQETKMDSNNIYDSIKLFMLIMVCVSEDQYANSLLHDSSILYSVFLYQAKLRHRKLNTDKLPVSRQLACSVLDLMIEFMQSHLMKNFPFELYSKAIGIIQRLMCYQKKYRIRLDYNWQNLWTSLISTLKFVVGYESTLLAKGHNLFQLYSKIVVIFNIFITYGDTFLPNPESYDYLYYDLMRMRQVFDNLLLLLNKYVSSSEWKENVIRLMNQMSNIRSIINHFTPKIDAWSNANHVASLTEQQVLDIVRTNYESLTLKLEDDLDQYERYAEQPSETSFFSMMIKRIISETRAHLSDIAKFDHVNILALSPS